MKFIPEETGPIYILETLDPSVNAGKAKVERGEGKLQALSYTNLFILFEMKVGLIIFLLINDRMMTENGMCVVN